MRLGRPDRAHVAHARARCGVVGIIVTLELFFQGDGGGTFAHTIGMQRLDLAVAEASQVLGVRLVLRTVPLAPPPLPTQRC